MQGFKKRLAFVVVAVVLILLPITGCGSGAIVGDTVPPSFDSRLVYATPDGLYERELTGGESQVIYEGESLSRPVFSQDGTKLLFNQTLVQTPKEKESGTIQSVLYAHDLQTDQTIKLLNNPVSYCAGPGSTFLISTVDGRILNVEFHLLNESGTLTAEMMRITPETVGVPEKDSITAVLYENLKPSPDFKYLAYNIMIHDESIIGENVEEGHSGVYSGGLHLLNMETGETSLVVAPIRHFEAEDGMGNNPEPGPWSRDGKILCVWDKLQSASITADGVSIFFYHADTGKKTKYDGGTLAYDENISYSGDGTVAVLGGGGREMFVNKWMELITDSSGTQVRSGIPEDIEKEGLIPAMPRLSSDGSMLYFAAIEKKSLKEGYEEGKWTGEDYNNVYPLKRQLYVMKLSGNREIRKITSDPQYRCESPVLSIREDYLVFGRGSAEVYDGKMELWMIDLSSGEEIKLAEWTEPEDTDAWATNRYNDYYGRGDWSGIFAIYGASK